MKIAELFKKDITRSINGVVKADQLDEESVWQELDEFVVTKELNEHLRKFFDQYCATLRLQNNIAASAKNGVWVSGFFGSGKSHFIKTLSHLLANEEHSHENKTTKQIERRRAVDFFEDKKIDSMTFANIKLAASYKTDVILFNIDSKADDKDAQKFNVVLAVFLKVLNQKLGYSPDHPHIAHLERYLDENGKYQEFQDIYKKHTGKDWKKERDAYVFNRDGIIASFSEVLKQSKEASAKWFDDAENNFSLTVENFAKWTKEYLDKCGKDRRIIFLADEVGQFIGSDTNLMLNLQTIVEELGVVCGGRAWIVVTSQEDIDAVINVHESKRKDFSKIQGRFATRLSLSSRNVDEVIQERLLRKNDENHAVKKELSKLYEDKGDILRNQLTFKDCGVTWDKLNDADDFMLSYPFVPYQFKLLQSIFESIRKIGVAGIHLAQGERSLLDAFQLAAIKIAEAEVGVLAPLYNFYQAIENFLESPVRRAFAHAENIEGRDTFDVDVLRVLFLIRHVENIKGNIENLVTLCLDNVDADRVALKKRIEESLYKLEKESLIRVNNGVYYFLTNEEQDISRVIKNIHISIKDQSKFVGKIIFDKIFKEQKKHRHSVTKKDFIFNRFCDNQPLDRNIEKALNVSIITQFCDDDLYYNDQKCSGASMIDGGKILIRLQKNDAFEQEVVKYLKTKNYTDRQNINETPEPTKSIITGLGAENRSREEYITKTLTEMLTNADCFVLGETKSNRTLTPDKILEAAFEYLIENTYSKLHFLKKLCNEPQKEMHLILYSDDITTLNLEKLENNPSALNEVREYVDLVTKQNKEINLYDACYSRFAEQPYGWIEAETALLFVKLYAAGEIYFVLGGDAPKKDELDKALKDVKRWKEIVVRQKKKANPDVIQKAMKLTKDIFAKIPPDAEAELYKFIKKQFEERKIILEKYKELVANNMYPGKEFIKESLESIDKMLNFTENEASRFFEKFTSQKEELEKMNQKFHDVNNFFEHQKKIWDDMLKTAQELGLNRRQLEKNESIKNALKELDEIKASPEPYAMIRNIKPLLEKITAENNKLIAQQHAVAFNEIIKTIKSTTDELAETEKMIKQTPDSQNYGNMAKTMTETANAISAIVDSQNYDNLLKTITETVETVTEISSKNNNDFIQAVVNVLASAKKLQEFRSIAEIKDVTETEIIDKIKNVKENEIKKFEEKTENKDILISCKTKTIRPADLITKQYIENKNDVNDFIKKLKNEMDNAIENKERIKIQ
ncbi:MAG: BREX system P-loop protein BrxC [Planctomycetaceae bacterium]|jgi:hypothetical protein|nr:BREX system P-loop protein BrxC [Planctomycetaceae bacterium]